MCPTGIYQVIESQATLPWSITRTSDTQTRLTHASCTIRTLDRTCVNSTGKRAGRTLIVATPSGWAWGHAGSHTKHGGCRVARLRRVEQRRQLDDARAPLGREIPDSRPIGAHHSSGSRWRRRRRTGRTNPLVTCHGCGEHFACQELTQRSMARNSMHHQERNVVQM